MRCAALAAENIAAYVRTLGDAVGKAWEEIGWLLGQMAAEIVLEVGVGVLLSVVTAGVGAAATAAKIAFTVARWAIRIAEVCHRLTTLIRGALTAARLTGRTAAHLVKDSIAAGVAGVASQIGYNELRTAIDPTYERQPLSDIAAGALIAGVVGGAGGVAKNVPAAKHLDGTENAAGAKKAGTDSADKAPAPRHPLDVGFGKRESSVITFGGVDYPKTSASNGKTTNVYDTSSIADADLERHVWAHARTLAGEARFEQMAAVVWTAVMPDGTHVTARQVSTAHIVGSTDRARWTIELWSGTLDRGGKRELKFK
ncbi:hypothetical protein [Agromyces larvae]|uniref:Uncharacterized protein n=1 Tax=Agromyces larvae TaxID=2929802 RepID=A0ABY4BUM2_9MICO|nr:hypothetical protein [Agromyces larvae]UOE42908.1 hypothetical protein MTO99_11990 [Agromyces larvae]